MALLIKNGTLMTASETYSADILVEGEKIKEIGTNLPATANGTGRQDWENSSGGMSSRAGIND
jgi:dihydroorotase-like cyclic amidohydrolase